MSHSHPTVSNNGPSIAVVVPILNEGDQMARLIPQLIALQRDGAEVIVVDGGSRDGSTDCVAAAGLFLLTSIPGRAEQMNAGALVSSADALLFLHADTELPEGALALVREALKVRKWGRFDVRIAGHHPMLPVVARMMNFRSRLTGISTGDQAIFTTRSLFFACGKFPTQALLEDVALCRSLLEFGRPACIRKRVTTSGRRWITRGVWRTIFLMWRIRWRYWRGEDPNELARLYR